MRMHLMLPSLGADRGSSLTIHPFVDVIQYQTLILQPNDHVF